MKGKIERRKGVSGCVRGFVRGCEKVCKRVCERIYKRGERTKKGQRSTMITYVVQYVDR